METLETLGGNTILPKVNDFVVDDHFGNNSIVISGRAVPGKRWVFTAWEDEGPKLQEKIISLADKLQYVIGIETCPTTQKKHWQGFISVNQKIRPSEMFKTKKTHWEKAKGNDDSNYDYCTKEGNFVTNMKRRRKVVIDPLRGKEPYKWQQNILDIIKTEADDRTIWWFWEAEGCAGKSTLGKHIAMNHNALVVLGKGGDIKYAVAQWLENNDLDVLIFDIPRTVGDCISYTAMEEIKNGCIFSTKYESGMMVFNSPHIICFSNVEPDVSKLSADRWKVINIRDNGML